MESTRAKEAEVRKETAEQLEVFRKQREAAEKAQFEEDIAVASTGMAGSPATQEAWAPRPKKRRRDKEAPPSLGAKLRKMSSTDSGKPDLSIPNAAETSKTAPTGPTTNEDQLDVASKTQSEEPAPKQKSLPGAALGLGGYSSDED